MNKQREIIYGMRRQILDGESQADTITEWMEDLAAVALDAYAPGKSHPEEWDVAGLGETLSRQLDVKIRAASRGEAGSRSGPEAQAPAAGEARDAEGERQLGH